jgi:Flp pilus assembly protein TadG
MKHRRWTSWRGLARSTRGAEIAETAMILPLLFMVILAIFWFGQAFRIYGTLTHAARQGARAAVAPVCATCAAAPTASAQNAITAINTALAAARVDKTNLQALGSWTPPALCACGSASSSCGTTVQCAILTGNSGVCVQPGVQLSYANLGGAGSCGTSISFRYKYPYRFVIPYTSLDLGNIVLPAEAQMRVETQ